MVSPDDLVRLPCTTDLIEEGLSFACRGRAQLGGGTDLRAYEAVRRAAAQTIVELAFRRHLGAEGVPFAAKAAIPFGNPDRYSVVLRGRCCNIRTFLISNRGQAQSIRESPDLLLSAEALVPLDEHVAEGQSPQDAYVFSFVLGGASHPDARTPRQGPCDQWLVHLMPKSWAQPQAWIPLKPMSLKSEGPGSIELQFGGQDGERRHLVRRVRLSPRTRQEIADDFHSLTYLKVDSRPPGRIAIHSPAHSKMLIISPTAWRDIWIDGTDLYLAGWMTREQYGLRARLIPEGTKVFQFERTRKNNLSVPISELKPISRLLAIR